MAKRNQRDDGNRIEVVDPPRATHAPPDPVPGHGTLWSSETGLTVVGRYAGLPQVVGERAASGSWETIPRQALRPMANWTGHQALKLEVKLRFDGWDDLVSVAPKLRALRSLEDRLPGEDAERRPPTLRLIGYTPGHYGAISVRWVIDNLAIEEEIVRRGVCYRATATITLLEWVSPQIKLRVQKTRSAARRYTWRKRDTLAKVAKRLLGSDGAQARQQIRDANPSIKKWTTVKVGTKIKIPASRTVAS
jgi:hypothetical protein